MASHATWQLIGQKLMRGRLMALLAVAAVLLHVGLVAQHRGMAGPTGTAGIGTSDAGTADRLAADLRLICSPASGGTQSLPDPGEPPGHTQAYCPICLGHAPGVAILAPAGLLPIPTSRRVAGTVASDQRPGSGLAPGLPRGRGPPGVA